jgi:hypothetical protein
MIKERVTAGPAEVPAAIPVKEKIPAPIMAPIPRVIMLNPVKERLRVW